MAPALVLPFACEEDHAQKISEESRLKTYKSPEAMAKEMFSSDSADVHLPHVHQGMLNHKKAIETLGAQQKTVVANSKAAMKTLSKQGKLLDQQDVGLKSQKSAILTMQKELSRLGRQQQRTCLLYTSPSPRDS